MRLLGYWLTFVFFDLDMFGKKNCPIKKVFQCFFEAPTCTVQPYCLHKSTVTQHNYNGSKKCHKSIYIYKLNILIFIYMYIFVAFLRWGIPKSPWVSIPKPRFAWIGDIPHDFGNLHMIVHVFSNHPQKNSDAGWMRNHLPQKLIGNRRLDRLLLDLPHQNFSVLEWLLPFCDIGWSMLIIES